MNKNDLHAIGQLTDALPFKFIAERKRVFAPKKESVKNSLIFTLQKKKQKSTDHLQKENAALDVYLCNNHNNQRTELNINKT